VSFVRFRAPTSITMQLVCKIKSEIIIIIIIIDTMPQSATTVKPMEIKSIASFVPNVTHTKV
jgi:hypothetical protein